MTSATTALSDAMRGASEAMTLAELARDAVARLGAAVGASGFLFGPDQATRPSRLYGELAPLVAPYLQGFEIGDPNHAAKEQNPQPVLVHSRHMDMAAYRASHVYNDYFRRYDIEHFVSVRLFDVSASIGPLTILYARGRSSVDFGAREARLLYQALPALNAAAVRAMRHEALLDERQVLASMLARAEPRAHMAIDRQGRILWLSTRAEALLQAHFGGPSALPEVAIAAARRLVELALGRIGSESVAHTLALQPAAGGLPIRARLAVVRTASGEPFVELELEVAEVPEARGLTPAEARVLALLGEGLTNAVIARRLFVSVETIKTHVHRVLDKLGVSSRAQAGLVARGLLPRGR